MKDISAKKQREIFENLGNEITKGIAKSIEKTQENKYKKFYEYIKHLLRNANLEENIVREKIREMEKGRRKMNIDNLIKELQQIDIEKLTDDELEELGENIPTLAEKTANEIVKRYVMNGGKFF